MVRGLWRSQSPPVTNPTLNPTLKREQRAIMKITAIIADDRRPEGWPECYTATHWDASPGEQARQIETLVARFNATILPGELPRRVLSVTSEEIDEADAFNMGMAAFREGKCCEKEAYWPKDHPNAECWHAGWEQAREDDENDSDDEEDEGDE